LSNNKKLKIILTLSGKEYRVVEQLLFEIPPTSKYCDVSLRRRRRRRRRRRGRRTYFSRITASVLEKKLLSMQVLLLKANYKKVEKTDHNATLFTSQKR